MDFAADQKLSRKDRVSKYTTLPTDPAANKAAQQAIAMLSTSTTVSQFLGLDKTIAANPIFSGTVAQTNLVALMATSPNLASAPVQTEFLQKYASFRGSAQDFWNQMSQDATLKAAIPELQFTMQLGVLTLNNPALVSALRASYKPASITRLGDGCCACSRHRDAGAQTETGFQLTEQTVSRRKTAIALHRF